MASSSDSDSGSFQLLSSLRFDPSLPEIVTGLGIRAYPSPNDSPYYLLGYHRDRLAKAAIHFGWQKVVDILQKDIADLATLFNASIPDKTQPWRLRVGINIDGVWAISVQPIPPGSLLRLLLPHALSGDGLDSPPWSLYVDSRATVPSAFTTHKTSVRDDYTAARARAGILSLQDPAEVLVVNPDGEIMEGSISTPYFRPRLSDATAPSPDMQDARAPTEWVTPPLSSGGNAGTTRRYALVYGLCVEQVVRADQLVDGEGCWLSNGVRGFIRAVVVLRKNGSVESNESSS
jgi:4-amino-4-deoxychorismate lyase